jgi:hypothetical protein
METDAGGSGEEVKAVANPLEFGTAHQDGIADECK